MNEIWKDIPNYDGYQVSNLGRVRTHNKVSSSKRFKDRHWKDRILKYKSKRYNPGYRVDLWKDGKPKTFLVARLVAFTFYEKDINDSKLTVDHIDGNRFNNKIENLDLVSLKENIRRGFENRLYKNQIKVKVINKENNNEEVFNSLSKASRYIGKNKGYISNAVKQNNFENKLFKWELV